MTWIERVLGADEGHDAAHGLSLMICSASVVFCCLIFAGPYTHDMRPRGHAAYAECRTERQRATDD